MWASKFAFDIMDFPVVAGVVVFRFCLESVCGAGVCFQRSTHIVLSYPELLLNISRWLCEVAAGHA